MNNFREKTLAVVRESTLSAKEVELWVEVLNALPEEFCSDILDFVQTVPDGLRVLTVDLVEKTSALQNKNLAQWEQIFNKEEMQLKSLIA